MKDVSMRVEGTRSGQGSQKPAVVTSTLDDRGTAAREMILAAGISALLMVSGVWAAVSLLRWFWREVF